MATMDDFTPGDSSRKKATLTWEAPSGVSGITGYRIQRTHRGQPDLSRYAIPIATVGSNARTYVHDASNGIPPETPDGFTFSYYVAAITADGDGFPAKVYRESFVSDRAHGPGVGRCLGRARFHVGGRGQHVWNGKTGSPNHHPGPEFGYRQRTGTNGEDRRQHLGNRLDFKVGGPS